MYDELKDFPDFFNISFVEQMKKLVIKSGLHANFYFDDLDERYPYEIKEIVTTVLQLKFPAEYIWYSCRDEEDVKNLVNKLKDRGFKVSYEAYGGYIFNNILHPDEWKVIINID